MTTGPVPPGMSADHEDEDATTAPHATTPAGSPAWSGAEIPGTITQVLAQVEALVRHLAATDWAGIPGAVTDEVIRSMERVDAGQAAIRGAAYTAFEAGLEHVTYAQRAMTGYLTAETGTTRTGARRECKWMRRHDRHRAVMAKLRETGDELTAPMAERICTWTDPLPDEFTDEADQILLTAHSGGLRETGLAQLAAQMRQALCPEQDDEEPGRGIQVETTIDGAGVIHGDLDPGCAALVQAAFDHYGQPTGPDDQRTHPERMHDALAAICREVLSLPADPCPAAEDEGDGENDLFSCTGDDTDTDAEDFTGDTQDSDHAGSHDHAGDADAGHGSGGHAPGGAVVTATGHSPATGRGAGQVKGRKGRRRRVPVRALVHLHMCDIIVLPGAPALQQAWAAAAAEQVAGERAAAWEQPGDGGTWLTGPQAGQYLQDALITPVVTGRIDASIIPRLAAAGANLHQALTTRTADGQDQDAAPEQTRQLVMDMLAEAVALMSGPAGYASFLRTRLFDGTILGTGSLPLDVGRSRYVPPQIRTALAIRDRGCAIPGGCTRPARDCEPHHAPPLSEGGETRLEKTAQKCWWHHHVLIHKHGWRVEVNPDGTTTAYRPDGTRHTPGTPPTRPPPPPAADP